MQVISPVQALAKRAGPCAALCAALAAAGAAAGPFDGVYVPNPTGQGADFGECADLGILIGGDRVRYFEVECEITNPVQIRDMDAVLYDGRCQLEADQDQGMSKQGRVLIRRMETGDLALVTPFMDVRLSACQVDG